MNHAPQENNILRAYRLGIEHGQSGKYEPPQWIVVKMGLWLTAYQNGNQFGQNAKKSVASTVVSK